jgi:nucleotide-binding universal stress UspA family protein
MKILIAYDGSVCSDNAIVDLRRAGLPEVAEARVLTVADVVASIGSVLTVTAAATPGVIYANGARGDGSRECERLEEARTIAACGVERLRGDFPGWKIDSEVWMDEPGAAIIRTAQVWEPDLIVVGSHGRTGIGRLVLGSVSLRVLHQVEHSVRISRHHLHSQERSIRVLIGVDGSDNSKEAVRAVIGRTWPAGTKARVVSVLDSRIELAAAGTLEGTIPCEIEDESRRRLSMAAREAVDKLEEAHLIASFQILAGKPEEVLLAEAERWGADCIFLGARKMSGLERLLMGSVSTGVVGRAHCSVEVTLHSVEASEKTKGVSASASV